MDTKNFEKNIKRELKEKPEKKSKLIIDFIRHGEPAYGKERYYSGGSAKELSEEEKIEYKYPPIEIDEQEAVEKAPGEGKLTTRGIEQIEKTADNLISSIDKEKEIIMLLVSLRTRALESAGVIKVKLEQAGIELQKVREHHLLQDIKGGGWMAFMQTNKELKKTTGELWKLWRGTEQEEQLGGAESYKSVSNRTKELISLIHRFADRYKDELGILESKALRVICVGHGEGMDNIVRQNFGLDKQKSVEPAALLEFDIKEDDSVNLRLSEREAGREEEKEMALADIK